MAKLKLPWLLAVVSLRLGHFGRALGVYKDVRQQLVEIGLGYEIGMPSIDLATLYLAQGANMKWTS